LRGAIAALEFEQIGILYSRAERNNGESKFSLGEPIGLDLDGILKHSVVPLRIAAYMGL
jgi:dolichol-phosphate mannosyltransferase